MLSARVAQWIRRRSPKPKIASSSLAVGNIFKHILNSNVEMDISLIIISGIYDCHIFFLLVKKNFILSGVGFEPTLPLENQSLNLAP